MKEEIRRELLAMAESQYRDFSASLIPGVTNMLGIRLPKLRQTAKKLATGNWQAWLEEGDIYFEETMLRGMIISYATAKMEVPRALPYIREFVPLVDSWSVCDSVFMKMDVLKKDRAQTWQFVLPLLESGDEFKVRIALIVIMQFLLKTDSGGKTVKRYSSISMADLEKRERHSSVEEKIWQVVNRPFEEGYYASMAAAWLLAEAFVCFPSETNCFLKQCRLDDVTYHKALQKIVESRIPDEEVKCYIRSMKKQK